MQQLGDEVMTEEKNVKSLEKALDIIEIVSNEQQDASLSEIARQTGLPKSTVHRLIATLTGRGYLEKTEAGSYKIGLKLFEAVSCYINNLELQTEARPYIAELTSHLGLTSYLGILDGAEVVYIEKLDAVSSMKMYYQIGSRIHAYCSSLGKCLLANYSKAQLDVILEDCSFIKFTPNTIASREELDAEIAKVRKQGWAMDNEEFEKGHRCIGAPIFDYKGDIIAAVSASGDKRVLTDDRIEEVAEAVMKAASRISHRMGYVE